VPARRAIAGLPDADADADDANAEPAAVVAVPGVPRGRRHHVRAKPDAAGSDRLGVFRTWSDR